MESPVQSTSYACFTYQPLSSSPPALVPIFSDEEALAGMMRGWPDSTLISPDSRGEDPIVDDMMIDVKPSTSGSQFRMERVSPPRRPVPRDDTSGIEVVTLDDDDDDEEIGLVLSDTSTEQMAQDWDNSDDEDLLSDKDDDPPAAAAVMEQDELVDNLLEMAEDLQQDILAAESPPRLSPATLPQSPPPQSPPPLGDNVESDDPQERLKLLSDHLASGPSGFIVTVKFAQDKNRYCTRKFFFGPNNDRLFSV